MGGLRFLGGRLIWGNSTDSHLPLSPGHAPEGQVVPPVRPPNTWADSLPIYFADTDKWSFFGHSVAWRGPVSGGRLGC